MSAGVDTRPTVALALGSGGARGYAHIGVIQVLEERGYRVIAVAGTSMGALVGGVFAAGHLDTYTEWVLGLSQLDVVRLLDPAISAPGVLRADKVLSKVTELLGDLHIEDMAIPFTAIATDLLGRREVWFQQGSAQVAIRSSIAIPGVITPVVLNGRLLVDGGIMNPVPVAPIAAVHADLTVAVDLAGEARAEEPADSPALETADPQPSEEWSERLRRGAATLLDRDLWRSVTRRFDRGDHHAEVPLELGDEDHLTVNGPDALDDPMEAFGDLPPGLSRFDVMNQSLAAMQRVVTRYRMAGYPADVMVSVPRDACRSLDFHRAAEMVELGRQICSEALDAAGHPDPVQVTEEPDEPEAVVEPDASS